MGVNTPNSDISKYSTRCCVHLLPTVQKRSLFFIRAKRVSNCCMQEKKTDRLSVCLSGCSTNLGFSVEKIVLVLV